jgi:N-acetylglucosamine-6-phosphate deacetylase
MQRLIKNVTVVLPDMLLKEAWLLISGDRIAGFGKGTAPVLAEAEVVEGNGGFLSPGFVDTHVHGGCGADFRDGTKEAFLAALRAHLFGGTTTIVPTLSSAAKETLLNSIEIYNGLKEHESALTQIPHLAGIHLEGPYFSQEQKGAQDSELIRNPDPKEYFEILGATEHIRRWSVACELPGALALGRELEKRGICASIGHSNATMKQAITAYDAGYSCVTHLYSGCSSLHRNGPFREGGVVEAAFLLDDLDVEVIADGVHLPPPFLRLIFKIKGPEKVALITDCIRPGGTHYHEGDVAYDDIEKAHPVLLENQVAIMPDRKNFAGSIATSSRLVRTIVQKCGISLPEAVRMAALTPARMLGLEQEIGSIAVGKRADLLLMDKSLNIEECFLSGASVQK